MVLPPELFQGIYFPTKQDPKWFATAYPVNEHPCVLALGKLAKELGVVIPISFFEKDGPRYFNSVAIAGASGEILGVYRKSHIPDGPGYMEKYYFRPATPASRRGGRARARSASASAGINGTRKPRGRLCSKAPRSCSTPRPSVRSRMTPRSTRISNGSAPCKAMRSRTPCRSLPRTASASRKMTARPRAITATPSSPTTKASLSRASVPATRACWWHRFDLDEIARYRAEWGFFRDRRTDLYAKSLG